MLTCLESVMTLNEQRQQPKVRKTTDSSYLCVYPFLVLMDHLPQRLFIDRQPKRFALTRAISPQQVLACLERTQLRARRRRAALKLLLRIRMKEGHKGRIVSHFRCLATQIPQYGVAHLHRRRLREFALFKEPELGYLQALGKITFLAWWFIDAHSN